jgi:hypothetical protein
MDAVIHRLGNQAFWHKDDNRDATNKLPDDEDKISGYEASTPDLTKRVGAQLRASPTWGPAQIYERERVLVEWALRIYAPSAPVQASAAGHPASRTAMTVVRGLGESKNWLAMSKADADYRDIDGKSYEYPSGIPNGKQLAAGDNIVLFRPPQAGKKRAGIPALPARIFGVARIDKVVPQPGGGMRDAVYAVGSHTPAADQSS